MTHEFELTCEVELEATPDQVWDAIATGPGIDSWFMGRNEVEPGVGGTSRMSMLGHTSESTVTAWEPGQHFALRSEPAADGTFMAFEYLIEARGQGSTVVRLVHSGIMGDDWEAEYDALSKGDAMYLRKLAVYLKHFSGRTATSTTFLVGPQVADADRARSAFAGAFGLTGTVAAGQPVRVSVDGVPAEHGVVAFAEGQFLCVRTDDSIYMLIHGYSDVVVLEQHDFADKPVDPTVEAAWQSWLASLA